MANGGILKHASANNADCINSNKYQTRDKFIWRCLLRLGQSPLYPSASHILLASIIFIWKTVADIIFQSENPPAQHEQSILVPLTISCRTCVCSLFLKGYRSTQELMNISVRGMDQESNLWLKESSGSTYTNLSAAQTDKLPLRAMQLPTQSHHVPQAGIKMFSLGLLH